MTTSRIVRLNVGGSIFSTTKATLTSNPDSFLARLVDSDLPSTVDESGALFIDRCPVRFRHVLNFLRDGSLPHWAQRDAWRLDEVPICSRQLAGQGALAQSSGATALRRGGTGPQQRLSPRT